MNVDVILCNSSTGTVFLQPAETMAEALDVISELTQLARRADTTKVPSLLPRLRDQVLLNLARFLTDGQFSDAAQEVFTQLAVKKERSTANRNVQWIAGFLVADALDAAIEDPAHWPEFDAKWDELKRILTVGF